MRMSIGWVLGSGLVMLALSPAQADDSDIFGANIQPNVMILFDSSGSMADSVLSHPYDPSITYTVVNKCGKQSNQACTSTVVWQQSGGGGNRYTLYKNTVAEVAAQKQAAADGLNTVGFWKGSIGGSNVNLFLGNYLNYQLGFCPSAPCDEPKIVIARRTIKNLIANTPGVRFGVMKFGNNSTPINATNGGQMMAPIGTDLATMQTAIDGINPGGYTPLGEFVYDAGQYFKGQTWRNGSTFTSPIQFECQPNFIILITDGLQNGAMDVRTEATNRFTQDHRLDLANKQNVIVHTVGFGITDPTEQLAANSVLQTAATNGGGTFYYANDAQELEAALQDAIRKVLQATFTFATPVLPSTSTTGSNRAYLAAFKSDPSSPFWQGFLKAYKRQPDGTVLVDNKGVPLPSELVWEAGAKLAAKPSDSRTIFTKIAGIRQDFSKSNAAISAAVLAVSATDRDKVIDFTRGIDAYDENLNGNVTEQRAWKLGDIFHSTPVLVTSPSLALADSSYQAFKSAQASRTTVLIAGANDGMLHAFRESDGDELWAFIPPDLLDNLSSLTSRSGDHPYFVDSSPIAADIKVGSNWKTIVVFGLRRGGTQYYALDVTDTTNPIFLWTFTDPKLGETWSEPAIGKVKIGTTEKYVAFVGGGYDTAQNNVLGKAFFVIDLATGTKLWDYSNTGSSDDRKYMNFSLAADPTAVDLNNDGLMDRVYIGDVGGQLWKFDVSSPSTAEWMGKRLFAAAPSQPNPPAAGEYYPAEGIYGAPSLAFDDKMQLWVLFGTGDRNHPNNTASNRFYGIKENTDMTKGTALTESDLVDVTNSDAAAIQGWFVRLGADEKVLASATIFNSAVFFTTFTPTTVVACDTGGGTAKLYALQMDTGFAAIDFATGDPLPTTNSSAARSVTIGSGIASRPQVVITYAGSSATARIVTATTSEQLPNNPAPPPSFLKQFLYWREVTR